MKEKGYLDMELLRFTTAGSVDDGKSTLIGRLLYDSKSIFEDQLEILETLKSKEELIGEIITLLQSPAKNVISGLKSGGATLAGLMKTLEERAQ